MPETTPYKESHKAFIALDKAEPIEPQERFLKNPPIAETIPFPNAAKSVFFTNPLNVSNNPVTAFPIAAPPLLHLMPFIAVVMAVPTLSPKFAKSKVDTKS